VIATPIKSINNIAKIQSTLAAQVVKKDPAVIDVGKF